MLRCCRFSCTSLSASCHVLQILTRFCTYVMQPCCNSSSLPYIRHTTLLQNLFALPCVRHAMLLQVHLNCPTCVMLCCCKFFCASSCYAAASSLARPYIRHATRLQILTRFLTYVMLQCCKSSSLPAYVMLRCCKFSCASLHTSCHAAASSLELPYMRHAMSLQILLRFPMYVMLRCGKFIAAAWHDAPSGVQENLQQHSIAYVGKRKRNAGSPREFEAAWNDVSRYVQEILQQRSLTIVGTEGSARELATA